MEKLKMTLVLSGGTAKIIKAEAAKQNKTPVVLVAELVTMLLEHNGVPGWAVQFPWEQ